MGLWLERVSCELKSIQSADRSGHFFEGGESRTLMVGHRGPRSRQRTMCKSAEWGRRQRWSVSSGPRWSPAICQNAAAPERPIREPMIRVRSRPNGPYAAPAGERPYLARKITRMIPVGRFPRSAPAVNTNPRVNGVWFDNHENNGMAAKAITKNPVTPVTTAKPMAAENGLADDVPISGVSVRAIAGKRMSATIAVTSGWTAKPRNTRISRWGRNGRAGF